MARTSVNFTLEPEVNEALDEFARLAGINKSAAANLILKGVLNEQPQELYSTMINALIAKGKQEESEVLKEVLEAI